MKPKSKGYLKSKPTKPKKKCLPLLVFNIKCNHLWRYIPQTEQIHIRVDVNANTGGGQGGVPTTEIIRERFYCEKCLKIKYI